MKSLAVILPQEIIEQEFKRKSCFVSEYFGKDIVVTYYVQDREMEEVLRKYLSEKTSIKILKKEPSESDILVFYCSEITKDYHPHYQSFLPGQHCKEVYTIDRMGRICRSDVTLTEKELPHIDTHIFNRLGPKTSHGEFYYFPYGYLLKYSGLGSFNSFGFRVPEDYLNLKYRPKNHRLILFFGGSSMWSMYSYNHEMFSAVLEDLLNNYCKSNDIDVNFSVLNFGMHSHVVFNEMLAYMLFCQDLKSEYVIAHDGWNDFIYGMLSDKFLLNEYDLIYQYHLEGWSQILHATSNLKATQNDLSKLEIINLPDNIISAYINRKKQFDSLVENSGSKFFWALQPSIYSKNALSSIEKEYIRNDIGCDNPFREPYKRVSFIYEEFVRKIAKDLMVSVLDVHDFFKNFGEDETLFGDIIHTVPAGDYKIALYYFEHFKKIINSEAVSSENFQRTGNTESV